MTRAALERIRPLIEEIVEKKLNDLLSDPDEGKRLRPEVTRRLRKALGPGDPLPASQVARRLGLRW